jgi:F-type H+-transporting ATPase subunit b
MDEILRSLGDLLLQAIPTFLLVVFLVFYLKAVFFGPLEKTLKQRYEATEGAQKAANEALARADAKTAEYEQALRAVRAEVYQKQEQLYQSLHDKETAALDEARKRADAQVREAKEQIAAEVRTAKAGLEAQSDMLAQQIADSLLRRSAA